MVERLKRDDIIPILSKKEKRKEDRIPILSSLERKDDRIGILSSLEKKEDRIGILSSLEKKEDRISILSSLERQNWNSVIHYPAPKHRFGLLRRVFQLLSRHCHN